MQNLSAINTIFKVAIYIHILLWLVYVHAKINPYFLLITSLLHSNYKTFQSNDDVQNSDEQEAAIADDAQKSLSLSIHCNRFLTRIYTFSFFFFSILVKHQRKTLILNLLFSSPSSIYLPSISLFAMTSIQTDYTYCITATNHISR